MKRQIILACALLFTGIGMANAKETPSAAPPTKTETSIDAKAVDVHISIIRGNWCLAEGSSCVIDIHIKIGASTHLIADISQFDSSYDGQTIDEFTFEAIENNEYRTYIVPTQTLQWTGEGFALYYE